MRETLHQNRSRVRIKAVYIFLHISRVKSKRKPLFSWVPTYPNEHIMKAHAWGPSTMWLSNRQVSLLSLAIFSSVSPCYPSSRVRPKPISAEIFCRIPNRIFCRNRIVAHFHCKNILFCILLFCNLQNNWHSAEYSDSADSKTLGFGLSL